MTTVLNTPSCMWAVKQRSLFSLAADIIQPDRIRSLTVFCTVWRRGGVAKTKLATNHLSIIEIPEIITNCTPDPFIKNLNATIILSSPSKTDRETLYTGVFRMTTILITPSTMAAMIDKRFFSWARQIIHPNPSRTLPMHGPLKELRRFWETKLPASHVSVIQIPKIIANSAPLVVIEDFYSAGW